MLHDLFDAWKKQCCVIFANQEWIVWDFQYEPPIFEGDKFQLSDAFPVFANVYQVRVTMKGNQSFLKCNCQLYEHCGMPCSHILVITNEIEDTMIAVQHQKVLQVNYGVAESKLSTQLMKATSMQNIHEDMGMPITNECLERSSNPTKSCLNLDIHEYSSDYPLLYNGTTNDDYQTAIFVLTHNNAVTKQELRLEFSQTDASPQGLFSECSSVISIHILLVCVRCEVILICIYRFVYVILHIRFGLYDLV
jgi:hypothetical protein